MELLPRIREMKNLMDRISLKYVLNPLDEQETKEMIEFRLKRAGYNSGPPIFSDEAIREIYHYTEGYPRRIAMLCHNALKTLVMESKTVVDTTVISRLMAKEIR